MNWNEGIRQTHRWVFSAFTLGVIINIVAMTGGTPTAWVGLAALLPLLLLLLTGLYLFMLPYAVRWRRARGPEGTHAR